MIVTLLITLLIVLCTCCSIRLAIGVIESACLFIKDTCQIFVMPLVMWVIVIIWVIFWVLGAVLILSVGKITPTDHYIAHSTLDSTGK